MLGLIFVNSSFERLLKIKYVTIPKIMHINFCKQSLNFSDLEKTKKTRALIVLKGIRKYRIEFGHCRPGNKPLEILKISKPFKSNVTKTVTIMVSIK